MDFQPILLKEDEIERGLRVSDKINLEITSNAFVRTLGEGNPKFCNHCKDFTASFVKRYLHWQCHNCLRAWE